MSALGRKGGGYLSRTTFQLGNWAGKFGKEYTDRNAVSLKGLDKLYMENYGITRTELNKDFLGKIPRSARILEVGSNIGTQLLCLQKMGFKNLYGIEPQDYACELAKKRCKGINIMKSDAFYIPFKDGYFDLVFTSGVLIHINPKDAPRALREIHRCSNKYIWGFEYYSEEYKEVLYRGKKNMLWKANFPKMYLDIFRDLRLLKEKYIKYLDNENIDVMFLLAKE